MTDLTLNEFRGVSKEELKRRLEWEAQNILGPVMEKTNAGQATFDLDTVHELKLIKKCKSVP